MKRVLVGVAAVVISLTACNASRENNIIGVWRGEVFGSMTQYSFFGDGKYEYIIEENNKKICGTYIYFEQSNTLQITDSENWTSLIKVTLNENEMVLTSSDLGASSFNITYTKQTQ